MSCQRIARPEPFLNCIIISHQKLKWIHFFKSAAAKIHLSSALVGETYFNDTEPIALYIKILYFYSIQFRDIEDLMKEREFVQNIVRKFYKTNS